MDNIKLLDETLLYLNEGYFSEKDLENQYRKDREEEPSVKERKEYHQALRGNLEKQKEKEFNDRYNEDGTRK